MAKRVEQRDWDIINEYIHLVTLKETLIKKSGSYEGILFRISQDLHDLKQTMKDEGIEIYSSRKGDLDMIEFPFKCKGLEDVHSIWVYALKMFIKEKLQEYKNK